MRRVNSYSEVQHKMLILRVSVISIVASLLTRNIRGHALLYEPPNRSSIWRFPEFETYNPIVNDDDNQLYCGGFTIQHSQNGGNCGICGDDFCQPRPRDNESGGKYDTGIIVRNYTAGEKILTTTLITSNHLGYFEFSLCPRDSSHEAEEESCFEKFQLPLSDGSGFRSYPVFIGDTIGYFNVTVLLPPKVTCAACVLRWQYKTGNTWGLCGYEEGPHGTLVQVLGTGCGPQEEFRGCADIAIFKGK